MTGLRQPIAASSHVYAIHNDPSRACHALFKTVIRQFIAAHHAPHKIALR